MSIQTSAAAASATPVDPLLALLVGAFGAALLTVVGGLIGAWIQSISEHRRWLRERRFNAYHEFMVDMSQMTDLLTTEITSENAERIKAKLHALPDQINRSSEAVSILGPRSVNAAGQDWIGTTSAYSDSEPEAGRAAMSRGRWQFLIAAGKELRSKNVGETPPKARPV